MSRRARLDRYLELAAGAVLPTADRHSPGQGPRGRGDDARLRADARAARAPRHPALRGRASTRRRERVREGARDGRALARTAPVCEGATLRHRPLPRLARAPAGCALARDPVLLCIRLRVRARSARGRLPCSATCRRPRRNPAGAARAARRSRREGAPISGAKRGVLPRGLRAGRTRLARVLHPMECTPRLPRSCARAPRNTARVRPAARACGRTGCRRRAG